MFKPIFPKTNAEVLMDVVNGADKETKDVFVGFGGDMYSKGLLRGSAVTLLCAMVPTAIYGLNRLLREHP